MEIMNILKKKYLFWERKSYFISKQRESECNKIASYCPQGEECRRDDCLSS